MKTQKHKPTEQEIYNNLYERVLSWLKAYKVLFLTLTFDNKHLEKTTEKTRERYIKEFLNQNSALYMLNKDYGSKKGREHYHALVIVNTFDKNRCKKDYLKPYYAKINGNNYKYGKIDFMDCYKKRIYYKQSFETQAKWLTDHMLKDTNKKSRIIESRKEPSRAEQIKRLELFYNQEKNKLNGINKNKEPLTLNDANQRQANKKGVDYNQLLDLLF